MIPFYLQSKLKHFNINTITDINKIGYCKVFAWLKDIYPNTTYKTLFDLYCLSNDLPINNIDEFQKILLKKEYLKMLPCYAPISDADISYYLDAALKNAEQAYIIDEIPIGAVIVKDNEVIGSGYNKTKSKNNILQHAELIAIDEATKKLNGIYLYDCDLYVTIEPCLMCSGAIIASRIKRVIFGAVEPKMGAVLSQNQVFNNRSTNHHTQVIGPVDNIKYSKILTQFLQAKRLKNKI